MVTGVDLVKNRSGSPPAAAFLHQDEIKVTGHSIECRVNAEDPRSSRRRPGPSRPTTRRGPGVRVDTAAYTQYVIPPFYDSMIAKLIVYAATREEAILRMNRALDEFIIEGVKTTIPCTSGSSRSLIFRRGTSPRSSWSATSVFRSEIRGLCLILDADHLRRTS